MGYAAPCRFRHAVDPAWTAAIPRDGGGGGPRRLTTPASYTFVDNASGLRPLLDDVESADDVALDTEADSLHHYQEKICLIQLSVDGRHWIVDLGTFLRMPSDVVYQHHQRIVQQVRWNLQLSDAGSGGVALYN